MEHRAQSDAVLCLNLAFVPDSWQVATVLNTEPDVQQSDVKYGQINFVPFTCTFRLKDCDTWEKMKSSNLKINPAACIQFPSQCQELDWLFTSFTLSLK